MTMIMKGPASADQIIQTYQRDSKVEEITSVWPSTPVERVALIRKSQRPADLILSLAWELWELDESEFRTKVYAVWRKTGAEPNWSWTIGDMFNHIDANPNWVPQPFDPKKWAAVQSWRPGMKASPPPQIGPLIAYMDAAGHGRLRPAKSITQSCSYLLRQGLFFSIVENCCYTGHLVAPWRCLVPQLAQRE